jgi:hypothetical protein
MGIESYQSVVLRTFAGIPRNAGHCVCLRVNMGKERTMNAKRLTWDMAYVVLTTNPDLELSDNSARSLLIKAEMNQTVRFLACDVTVTHIPSRNLFNIDF